MGACLVMVSSELAKWGRVGHVANSVQRLRFPASRPSWPSWPTHIPLHRLTIQIYTSSEFAGFARVRATPAARTPSGSLLPLGVRDTHPLPLVGGIRRRGGIRTAPFASYSPGRATLARRD